MIMTTMMMEIVMIMMMIRPYDDNEIDRDM